MNVYIVIGECGKGEKSKLGNLDFLACPECDEPAIPSSGEFEGFATWSEDDPEVTCPGCGCKLYVNITGEDGEDRCEAKVDSNIGVKEQ
jgi:hypothetical protein